MSHKKYMTYKYYILKNRFEDNPSTYYNYHMRYNSYFVALKEPARQQYISVMYKLRFAYDFGKYWITKGVNTNV